MVSHMRLLFQSTPGINGYHSPLRLATLFSLNSPCFHPSTASFLSPLQPLQHPPFTPPTSSYLINTVSITSKSITSDHSSPTSKRRTRLLYDTLRTMSGQGVGSSVMLGHGSLVSRSRSLDGWLSLRCGCGANQFR